MMPGRDTDAGVYVFKKENRARALKLDDIGKTIGFIDFDAGGEIGIVQAKIFTPEFPGTDGYQIISWISGGEGQNMDGEPVVKYASFFPQETISRRIAEENLEKGNLEIRTQDPCLLERGGIYRLYPEGRGIYFCGNSCWNIT